MITRSVRYAHCWLFALLLPLAAVAGPATDQRIAILGERIQQSPQEQVLYLKRALVFSDNGQLQPALADVARAREVGPAHDAALVHGILLYRAGEFQQARQQFDAFLQQYPDHTAALQYRARLLRDSGAAQAALADYLHLFRLQPEQDPGHYLAAAALTADTQQALSLLDARMATTGPIPQLQRKAIELEKRSGNYAAAMDRLATLDAATRATAAWHIEMAELLQLSGQPDLARPHLAIAREQLAAGRPTSARMALQQQLESLEAAPLAAN